MVKLSAGDTIPLSSGTHLGFGVYLSPPEVTSNTVAHALAAGYKHIDSAQWYFNEAEVGQGVLASGRRDDVFLTTKLGHADRVEERLAESVGKIDPRPDGYVDLFLIHSPTAGPDGRPKQWKAMETLVEQGKAKAIGVSNYGVRHLKEFDGYARIQPAVNQIEQPDIVAYCQSHGIALEAYSPLVQGSKAQDPTLLAVARETGKTWAQVLIRWSLQRGFIPLPKSDTKERIIANRDVYDFELSAQQMAALDALDRDEHVCINNTDVP